LTDSRFSLIHVSRCRGITRHWIRKVLQKDSSLQQLYQMTPQEINHYYQLPLKNATILYQDLHDGALLRQLESELNDFHVVTILDKCFSPMLKAIQDPPLVLYALGDINLLKQFPTLSVIGTRNPSREAMRKVARMIKPLVCQNWLIVSGMAKGVDRIAHETTLDYQGKTIAVLGSGFYHIYPRENTKLFQKIIEQGLVLSEYSPSIQPTRYHFPERNRIISGLSFGTLVIEATQKSGTMITVDHALDQGREVFAVPGSLFSEQTKGCHLLIQDGAKLVMSANDILDEWNSLNGHTAFVKGKTGIFTSKKNSEKV
jgi:DNA processing protein